MSGLHRDRVLPLCVSPCPSPFSPTDLSSSRTTSRGQFLLAPALALALDWASAGFEAGPFPGVCPGFVAACVPVCSAGLGSLAPGAVASLRGALRSACHTAFLRPSFLLWPPKEIAPVLQGALSVPRWRPAYAVLSSTRQPRNCGFLRCRPCSGIAASHGSFMPSFQRHLHTVFHSG